MPSPEIQIDLRDFTAGQQQAIQQQADEWGVSFDDACLRLLVEHSRALKAERKAPLASLIARLFRSRTAH